MFNAFATLGGNIVFYRELLVQMPHENALAMVMAHEMAHVIHRDALAASSGGVATLLALQMLTGDFGSSGSVFTKTGSLAQLKFGRDMESSADSLALSALAGHYGHVAGADTLFRILTETRAGEGGVATDAAGEGKRVARWLSEFGSSHPLDYNRIDALSTLANEMAWPHEGDLTPLPAAFTLWLKKPQPESVD